MGFDMAVMAVKGLRFTYPGSCQPVLADVSYKLQFGQRIGLIGDNGSGKSTLLHLLLGLLPRQAGEIEIFGKKLMQEADFIPFRGTVGLLFQNVEDQLFHPTVIEDIAFGPLNLGQSPSQARQTALTILAQLQLGHYADKMTYRLSSGEQRLIALASILAMRPKILLLDEPTTGLDKFARQRVIEVLLNLPQAMLIVSHDEAFLQQVSQQQWQLQAGQLHFECSGLKSLPDRF